MSIRESSISYTLYMEVSLFSDSLIVFHSNMTDSAIYVLLPVLIKKCLHLLVRCDINYMTDMQKSGHIIERSENSAADIQF